MISSSKDFFNLIKDPTSSQDDLLKIVNDISDNNNIVNNHTGIEHFIKSKKAPTPLFEPTKDNSFKNESNVS